MEPMIRKLAEHTWAASRKESRIARTVVLKLKNSEFKILTRSHTPGSPPSSCEELTNVALRPARNRQCGLESLLLTSSAID
jgi:DNA polymerase-4